MNRIIGMTIIAMACAWSLAIAWTCWYAGDYMIGFSPFILLGIPFAACVLIVGLIFAASRKSRVIAACSLFGSAVVVLPFFFGHQITQTAWRNSLKTFSAANQTALKNVDFSTAEFTDFDWPDEKRMTPITGFTWYCEQHHAAPNGMFHGFRYNSIEHIYVNKIRHGFRGVAWIPNPELISPSSDYQYRHSGVDNWYVWLYGG